MSIRSLLPLLCITLLLIANCGTSNKPRGSVCQSDDQCAGVGPCIAYECVSLSTCNTDSDCTAGICNKGYCYATECDANKPCAVGYVCHEKGYCVQAPTGNEISCNSPSDCDGKLTLGSCQQAACTSGQCVAVPKPKETSCTHDNSCTSDGKCDDAGTCQPGPNTCDCAVDADCQGKGLEDDCNKAVCNDQKKCVKSVDTSKVNQSCNDGDGCTSGETCNAQGQCTGGSNPCINDPQNSCQQGATCQSTSATTYTCSYVKKPCDDGNPCTNATCNVSTGTCDADTPKLFQTGCEIVGAIGPTMCGVDGYCREVSQKVVTDPQATLRFQQTLWPSDDAKMFALATTDLDNCVGGFRVIELDHGSATVKATRNFGGCDNLPVGDRDMVLAIRQQMGFETMRYNSGTKGWDFEDDTALSDPQIATFRKLNFEVRRVRAIRRLGLSTYFAGYLVTNTETLLTRCTDQKCTFTELALNQPSGNWETLHLIGETINGVDTLATLTVDSGNMSPPFAPWRVGIIAGNQFTMSCNGDKRESACFSPFGWPGEYLDTAYWNYSNTGFHDLGGFSNGQSTTMYLTGESRWAKMIGFNLPFTHPKTCQTATQTTDCESGVCEKDQGNGGTCKDSKTRTAGRLVRFDKGTWTEVTSQPSLTEPPGDASLIDYVYSKVTTVQAGKAVVIAGFYRACFGNCITPTTTNEYVNLQAQAFLVTYYPESDSWSPMQLLGSPLTRRCCYGQACPTSGPTGQGDDDPWTPRMCSDLLSSNGRFLDKYPVALSFKRTVGDGNLYLLANPLKNRTCKVNSDCAGIGNGLCVGVVPGTYDSGWCASSAEVDATYFYFLQKK